MIADLHRIETAARMAMADFRGPGQEPVLERHPRLLIPTLVAAAGTLALIAYQFA